MDRRTDQASKLIPIIMQTAVIIIMGIFFNAVYGQGKENTTRSHANSERIAVVENHIASIKESQKRQESDFKEFRMEQRTMNTDLRNLIKNGN